MRGSGRRRDVGHALGVDPESELVQAKGTLQTLVGLQRVITNTAIAVGSRRRVRIVVAAAVTSW